MNNLSPLNDLIGRLEGFVYTPANKKAKISTGSAPVISERMLRRIKILLKEFSKTITDKIQPQNDREKLFSTLNVLLRTLYGSPERSPLFLSVESIIILAIKHFAPQKSPEFSHPYALDLILSELTSETEEERIESLNTIRGFYATAPERVPVWIANWIYKQEIQYRFCQYVLSAAEIESILPHMKYLNFVGQKVFSEVIQHAPKLEVLIANTSYNNNTFPIPPNLKILDCSNSDIKFLPEKMPYLQVLKCVNSAIVSFPKFEEQQYSKLTHFNFETPRIWTNTGDRYPTDLDPTYISDLNQLLERSPHLTTLSMMGPKSIIEHIKIPSTVRRLSIICRDLESISSLPENLVELNIINCDELVEIPRLPDSLVKFQCNTPKMRPLDELPPNLEYFDCTRNSWTQLPQLPGRLRFLRCTHMLLTTLPELPPFLEELHCWYNDLISLPELPKSLKVLDVDSNELQKLPKLPKNLEKLYCRNNKLEVLPPLPKTLILCSYQGNPLKQQRNME